MISEYLCSESGFSHTRGVCLWRRDMKSLMWWCAHAACEEKTACAGTPWPCGSDDLCLCTKTSVLIVSGGILLSSAQVLSRSPRWCLTHPSVQQASAPCVKSATWARCIQLWTDIGFITYSCAVNYKLTNSRWPPQPYATLAELQLVVQFYRYWAEIRWSSSWDSSPTCILRVNILCMIIFILF